MSIQAVSWSWPVATELAYGLRPMFGIKLDFFLEYLDGICSVGWMFWWEESLHLEFLGARSFKKWCWPNTEVIKISGCANLKKIRHFRMPSFWILEISIFAIAILVKRHGIRQWPMMGMCEDICRTFREIHRCNWCFPQFFCFNRNSDDFMKQITIGGPRRQSCWHLPWFLHLVILRNRSLPENTCQRKRKLSIIKVGLRQLVPNSLRCACF